MKKILSYFHPIIDLLRTKTAINTYMVFVGNGLSAFFAFVFTVTAFREMTVADFGYFSAMLSFMLIVSDLSDWGIGTSLSTFLPPLEGELAKLLSFLKSAFAVQTIIALGVCLILYLISPLIAEMLFHTNKLIWLVQIGVLGIFWMILANFFQYSLSARQRFLQASILSAYNGILRVAAIFLLMILSSISLASMIWLQLVTLVLTAITALFFLETEFIRVKHIAADVRKLLTFTSFVGIARGMTAVASRLDVLMLVALRSPIEAGIYSTASRVISIYPLLAGSFSQVIAPKLSAATDKNFIKKFMMKVIFGTAGIIATNIFMIIIAEPFMVLLFSEKARPAVQAFQFLLVSMIFFVASIPVVSLIIYYLRKPHILSFNGILQFIIVVLANLYFIPRFGKLGPAFSLILAYSITLVITIVFCLIYLGRKHAAQK